jgi:branched-chain amino acid transport system permease protein
MGIPGLQPPVFSWPGVGTLDGNNPVHFYWMALVFMVVIVAAVYRLLHSRIGRAYVAINLDEHLARSQGIPVFLYQLSAFAVSAIVGGLAGGLYVFHLSIVDPGIFDIYYTQMMLIMVIVGGAGHFWCVLLMAFVFTFVPEALRLAPELRMILFGIILVVVIQFMPQGLGGFLGDRKMRKLRKGGL